MDEAEWWLGVTVFGIYRPIVATEFDAMNESLWV
jgi:hypothetical protein